LILSASIPNIPARVSISRFFIMRKYPSNHLKLVCLLVAICAALALLNPTIAPTPSVQVTIPIPAEEMPQPVTDPSRSD